MIDLRTGCRSALRHALDLVFPRHCVHCGDAVEGGTLEHLCAACEAELFLVREPACSTCGHPFFGVLTGPRSCPHCEALEPAYRGGKTLFLARGPGRALLHELKYHNGHYVLRDIARLLRQNPAYRRHLRDAVLVPVPLHPTRERERGYNQSAAIARTLAAEAPGHARVEAILERRRYTRSQTRLNREARNKNVKNAFALRSDAVINPPSYYVLVDDVFTTGSTLTACSRVLRQAGARHVAVATLGHG